MANTINFMEGFENYTAFKALAYNIPPTSSRFAQVAGYDGGSACAIYDSTNNSVGAPVCWRVATPVLNSTWNIMSFMFYRMSAATLHVAGFSNSSAYNGYYPAGNCRMLLGVNMDGRLYIQGDGTNLDYTTSPVLNIAQWYHIEYRHRYGNVSNGNFEVYVNGSLVLNGLRDNSAIVTPTIAWIAGNGLSAADVHIFDHVIGAQSTDASPTRFGISKVRNLIPTSTTTAEWMGSDADQVNNHLLVDDGDNASADYVTSTAGSGQRDLYGHAAAATGATVHGVQVRAAAGLDTVGTDDFSLVVKSGSSENLTRKTLGAGTPAWSQGPIIQNDPATAVAWTKAGFDASLFGVKS